MVRPKKSEKVLKNVTIPLHIKEGAVTFGAVDKALKVIIQKVQSFGSEPFVVLDKNAKIWYNISIESEGYKC